MNIRPTHQEPLTLSLFVRIASGDLAGMAFEVADAVLAGPAFVPDLEFAMMRLSIEVMDEDAAENIMAFARECSKCCQTNLDALCYLPGDQGQTIGRISLFQVQMNRIANRANARLDALAM